MENMYRELYRREVERNRARRQAEATKRMFRRRNGLVVGGLLLIIIIAGLVAYNRPDNYAYEIYTYHRVMEGDTLWAIAREHKTPQQDIRQVVWLIQQANDMNSAVIHPWDLLRIPVFDSLLNE